MPEILAATIRNDLERPCRAARPKVVLAFYDFSGARSNLSGDDIFTNIQNFPTFAINVKNLCWFDHYGPL